MDSNLHLVTVSSHDLQALAAAVDHFAQLFGANFKPLQPADSRRMPRPRKNAAEVVQTTAVLSKRYGVESPSNPVEVMLANQQLVETLRPVAEQVDALQKLLTDVIFVAGCNSWRGATTNYALLKREGRTNAVLKKALEPIAQAMRPSFKTENGSVTHKRSSSAQAKAKKAKPADDATTPSPTPSEPVAPTPAPAPVAAKAAANDGSAAA